MIIEPHTPDGEELSKRHGVGFPTLQPHLTRCVMGVYRCLERSNPVDSHVSGHFHRCAIDGNAEIDDAGVLIAAARLRFQSSGCDVGDGVPRGAPWGRRTPLLGWRRRSLPDAASEHEQNDDQRRPRSGRAPPTGPHGTRIERRRCHAVPAQAPSRCPRWYIAFRPSSGPQLAG